MSSVSEGIRNHFRVGNTPVPKSLGPSVADGFASGGIRELREAIERSSSYGAGQAIARLLLDSFAARDADAAVLIAQQTVRSKIKCNPNPSPPS